MFAAHHVGKSGAQRRQMDAGAVDAMVHAVERTHQPLTFLEVGHIGEQARLNTTTSGNAAHDDARLLIAQARQIDLVERRQRSSQNLRGVLRRFVE